MQILAAAVVVLALAYFTVLKPGGEDEFADAPIPTTPAATTPAVAAGGEQAESSLGKTIEGANDAVAASNEAANKSASQTGEEDPAAATTPADDAAPAGSDAAAAGTGASGEAASGKTVVKVSASEARANKMLHSIQTDQKSRRVSVVLVYDKKGIEEASVKRAINGAKKSTKKKARYYRIPVSQIGAYDAIVGTLSLAQTPSTIIIAPDGTAKVLGGVTSSERIVRLVSSASAAKPAEDAATKQASTVAP